jgi:hypothetical protein
MGTRNCLGPVGPSSLGEQVIVPYQPNQTDLFYVMLSIPTHLHIHTQTIILSNSINKKGVYRDSIRFHTWLRIAQITYSTMQIIFRDATVLYLNENLGNPERTVPEFILWSICLCGQHGKW